MKRNEEFIIPDTVPIRVSRIPAFGRRSGVIIYGRVWNTVPINALAVAIYPDGEIRTFTVVPVVHGARWRYGSGHSTRIGKINREHVSDVWKHTLVVFHGEDYEM